ncbi:MFS transporter [Rhodococcus sp. NPDC059968]|uniref:MFS transporter n=1 Tax=Rhodococcus sp. NPDC059968 TaxID=3347017 RepID=UPI00366E7B54
MGALRSPNPTGAGSDRRLGAAAGFVGFLFAMELSSGFLQAWFSPILSAIGEKYSVGPADLNWVQTSYLLATAVLVPLLAKMGDQYGHKRMLVVATAMVTVGSVVSALAPTYGIFILGRAITGALAAFLPFEFAIVRERAGEQSGKAIGLLVGGLTLGASVGVVLSGVLASFLSLTVLLLVPAALMALALVVVVFFVPETTARTSGRLDWAGAILLGAGLAFALFAISTGNRFGWASGPVLGGLLLGGALLALWVVLERRVASPLVDFAMLSGRAGVGLPILLAALFGAQLFGSQTPIALFVGTDPAAAGFGLGLSSSMIGLVLVFASIAAFVGTFVGPRLGARVGDVTAVIVGAVTAALGYALLTALHSDTVSVLAWLVVSGLGNGIIISALPNVVVARAPRDSVGIASGLYNSARTVAGAIAGASFTAVMSGFTATLDGGSVITSEAGYQAVWVICGLLSLAVAGLAVVTRGPAADHRASTVTAVAPAEA